MTVTIRPERDGDAPAIRSLIDRAFRDHPHSDGREGAIVDALREANALALSWVAEDGGRVVAQIAFSAAAIDGAGSGWVLLGPVAVEPAQQRRGIGTRLVRAALEHLRSTGAAGCVLVGEPAYYGRFGFRHVPGLTVAGVPETYVLALPFADELPRGEVHHHAAFTTAGRQTKSASCQ